MAVEKDARRFYVLAAMSVMPGERLDGVMLRLVHGTEV
jgi:hypothetical protein